MTYSLGKAESEAAEMALAVNAAGRLKAPTEAEELARAAAAARPAAVASSGPSGLPLYIGLGAVGLGLLWLFRRRST